MSSQGLVGFFDILGYQNIIDNNTIDDVSSIINNVLLKLPDNVRTEFLKPSNSKPDMVEFLEKSISGLESRLISDSILLVFPINPTLVLANKLFLFFIFTNYISDLLTLTFRQGLPLRGAMDFGEFFLEDHCFAGKPIINSYRLGSSLDFSGCVMTPQCRDTLISLFEEPHQPFIKLADFGYDYLCPCRDKSFSRLWMIPWFHHTEKTVDLRQSVFEAFKAHNKDIGPGVEKKITNTELTLRFLKQKAAEEKKTQKKQQKSE